MAIYEIPLEAIANQTMSTVLNGLTYFVTLETRLNNLYITLSTRQDVLVRNRICRDRATVGFGFTFFDLDGATDPIFSGIGTRYVLLWNSDEA